MHPKYPNLFKEGYIGKIRIPNRIVMSGMCVTQPGEEAPGDFVADYYARRAKGGAGLVILGATSVSGKDFDPYPVCTSQMRIEDDSKIARFAEIAEEITKFGAVAGIQLTPGLGQNENYLIPGVPPLSCSPAPCKRDPSMMTKEMTRDQIHQKVRDMADAAERAYKAGFRIIDIHCHSGYLAEQFMNPAINKRTDEYGGDHVNRFRFMQEIITGIRERLGDKIGLMARFSINHMAEGMLTIEDSIIFSKMAKECGVDVIDTDIGSYRARQWVVPGEYVGPETGENFSARLRKEVGIPILHAGGYQFAADCEKAIAEEHIDFAALGRPLIADPDWPRKVKNGREDEIRRCLHCVKCLVRAYDLKLVDCSVNPVAVRETRQSLMITPAEDPKKVAIIGGGPGGMVTALVAKRRGHDVTILEKSGRLGGQLNLAGIPEYKEELRGYRDYLIRQIELKKIPVKLGFEATAENLKEMAPDVIVVATGADVYMPKFIPGYDKKDVVTVRGLYERKLTGKEKVVVIGGGLVGCETALGLGRDGHEVEIVEMLEKERFLETSFLYRDLNCAYLGLIQELNAANIRVHTGTKVKCIEDDKVICIGSDGKEFEIPRDIVVMSTGRKSVLPEPGTLEEIAEDVYYIGDCREPGSTKEAVHSAYYTALKI